jgi:hypothetical protein
MESVEMHRMREKNMPDGAIPRPQSMVEKEWEAEAKRVLKAELARQGVTYRGLAARLESMGIRDDEKAIGNRISRGKFAFTFFLQCMRSLGVEHLDLTDRTKR